MAELPVREMVLYKHGVGFFVRQGAVSSEEITLTFRKDEINDVLKSLAVFDQGGGQILGIHYQTPMDVDARLASSSVRLAHGKSMGDLIRDLRGRRAELTFERFTDKFETINGRVVGMDEPGMYGHDKAPVAQVSIMADNGQVFMFPLDSLRSVEVKDEQALHDLGYFLDTSMVESERRLVNVRLSQGEHDLVVYYVAPSPTWRVSYRLVAEQDKDSGATGKALLQGWGLFDNRLEEDLENVRVTLVAGQPISFIYDLYESRIPYRPTVKDESRVAPGPIEYEGADLDMAMDMLAEESDAWQRPVGMGLPEEKARGFARHAAPAAPAPRMDMAAMAQSAQPAAETKATGETFQYLVTTPVTVKRGESALVPIIGSQINYERELLYNRAKLPGHPVAALRFKNSTGLTLERGPVTVVEDGDYKGEAVVPFSKEENSVYLPYAVELGIKITEKSASNRQTVRLNIQGAYLVFEEYVIDSTLYILENTTGKKQTVTIEAPAPAYTAQKVEFYETRPPDVETASEVRWKVEVEARTKTDFNVKTRYLTSRHEQIQHLDYRRLSEYLKHQWLDNAMYDTLKNVLDTLALIHRLDLDVATLEGDRQTLYQQQEQLRANLTALQPTGEEAALRSRLLRQLEESQNKLDALEDSIQQKRTEMEAAAQKLRDEHGIEPPKTATPPRPLGTRQQPRK